MTRNIDNTPSDQRIAEIRARLAARTQGGWKEHINEDGDVFVAAPRIADGFTANTVCFIGNMEDTEKEDHANAAFIAAAPDDITFLLAQLDHRNALIERTGRVLAATLFELESLQSEVDQLLAVVKAQEGEL